MNIKKYCSITTIAIIYVIGCIYGLYKDFIYLTTHSETFGTHLINGILTPFMYGGVACLGYFIMAIAVSYFIENHVKEKAFIIISSVIVLAIALFFTFTIKV